MKNISKVILLSLVIMAITYSCKRRGCMDDCATNYDAKAEKESGSCTFADAQVTFWTDGNTHGPLDIYVDGTYEGTIEQGASNPFIGDSIGPADCGDFGTLTLKRQYGTYDLEARGTCCDFAISKKVLTIDPCDACVIYLFKD